MLLQVRDFMRREKIASSQQIARELALDPAALEPMLELWCRKGVIEPCESPRCGTPKKGCGQCGQTAARYYRWVIPG